MSTRNKLAVGVAAIGAIVVLANLHTGEPAPTFQTVATTTSQTVATTTSTAATRTTTTLPQYSVSVQNAIRSAKAYLDFTSFSKSGLIDQLEFEGYSTADATEAVNSLHVNWYEQAALKAQEYLDFQPFSRSGLIDQLEFEGFTRDQAEYGADKAGL